MEDKNPQEDVLHFENPSQLTPEEIMKAIKHHQQRHHKGEGQAEQQASSQQSKNASKKG